MPKPSESGFEHLNFGFPVWPVVQAIYPELVIMIDGFELDLVLVAWFLLQDPWKFALKRAYTPASGLVPMLLHTVIAHIRLANPVERPSGTPTSRLHPIGFAS